MFTVDDCDTLQRALFYLRREVMNEHLKKAPYAAPCAEARGIDALGERIAQLRMRLAAEGPRYSTDPAQEALLTRLSRGELVDPEDKP